MSMKRFDQTARKHGDSIVLSLAVSHDDFASLEIEILHSQSQTFEKPEAAAVRESRHEPMSSLQSRENALHFIATENDRQALRPLRPFYVVEPRKLDL